MVDVRRAVVIGHDLSSDHAWRLPSGLVLLDEDAFGVSGPPGGRDNADGIPERALIYDTRPQGQGGARPD